MQEEHAAHAVDHSVEVEALEEGIKAVDVDEGEGVIEDVVVVQEGVKLGGSQVKRHWTVNLIRI